MFRLRRSTPEVHEEPVAKQIATEETTKTAQTSIGQRMKYMAVSQRDFDTVKVLLDNKCTITLISKVANISPITVSLIREATDLEDYKRLSAERTRKYSKPRPETTEAPRPKARRVRKNGGVTDAIYAVVKTMLAQERSHTVIAETCGIGRSTVSRIRNSNDIDEYRTKLREQNAKYLQHGNHSETAETTKPSEHVEIAQAAETTETTKTTTTATVNTDGIATIDLAALEQTVRKDANILCERLLDLSSQQLTIENLENAQRTIEHFSESCQTLKSIKALAK